MKKSKKRIKTAFILYLIALTDLVIFKFFGDAGSVAERIQNTISDRNEGNWNFNLIPLRTIQSEIDFYARHSQFGFPFLVLAVNIFIFLPMGLLISFLFRKPSFLKTIGISLAIISGIELLQFVTCLGILDIDDIILNTAGCAAGYLIFAFKNRIQTSGADQCE